LRWKKQTFLKKTLLKSLQRMLHEGPLIRAALCFGMSRSISAPVSVSLASRARATRSPTWGYSSARLRFARGNGQARRSQRDICIKFITPGLRQAGWDETLQIRPDPPQQKGFRRLATPTLAVRSAARPLFDETARLRSTGGSIVAEIWLPAAATSARN
jgi:hypothetical protein